MMPKRQLNSQRGISVIELMVAVLIGVAVLGAGIAFMLNTSRSIRLGQEQAKNTSKAQQVLAAITKELKSVNIEAPPLYAVTPAWSTLPALPHYTHLELPPAYTNPVGTVITPAVPAARRFASQSGATDMAHKWYPNPTGEESNSLVFYKAPPPGPGGTSTFERISYRLVNRRLLREVQRLSALPTSYSVPAPSVRVLADEVFAIQFSYPTFEQQMTAALDTQLTTIAADPARQIELINFINQSFRKVIGIRIVMGGGKIGSKDVVGVELKTEVRLRSE